MVTRAILLMALAAFLLPLLTCADDAPTLPSRKATVVIPLLNQISPKDSPQSVLGQIAKILGQSDDGEGGGPRSHFWFADSYWLDDKTQIDVGTRTNEATGIILSMSVTIQIPNGKPKVLYSFSKT